jgi:beta-galactosidase GanA
MLFAVIFSTAYVVGGAAMSADIQVRGHEIFVDGNPYIPFGVVDHCHRDEYRRIKEFNLGINTVAQDSLFRNMMPNGSLDKELEDLRSDLDEAHRNGLKVLVMLGGSAPPDWLFEKYPDCRVKKANGTDELEFTWNMYSVNHPGVRKELSTYFEKIAIGLNDHPALLGWILWNEPYLLLSVDYHPATMERFQQWLAEKYGNIKALNSRWLARYAEFGEVHAPAHRTSANPVAWTDWMLFRQENFADFFQWEKDIIHKADPGHLISTKIRAPLDLDGDSAGQRAVNTRMWSQ